MQANEVLKQAAAAYLDADRTSQAAYDTKQAALMIINEQVVEILQSAGVLAQVVTCGRGGSYQINIRILSPDYERSDLPPSALGNDHSQGSTDSKPAKAEQEPYGTQR